MAAASLPVRLTTKLELGQTPNSALAEDPLFSLSLSGTFTEQMGGRLYLEGADTTTFTPPSLPNVGAKLIIFYYESGSTGLSVNGVEITPGGVFLIYSPSPTEAPTEVVIVHTADASVRVKVLG